MWATFGLVAFFWGGNTSTLCANALNKFKLTFNSVKPNLNGINAKSLIGIEAPHIPERKRAHLKAAFFVPAHFFLIWWRGMGSLRAGRSLGGSFNLCRVITRELKLSFDGLKKPFTREHSHV